MGPTARGDRRLTGAELTAALASQERGVVHETHGSWVVVAGQRAWKIRKPVRWSFLDYSDVPARRAAGIEEVRVNTTLAPRIYLGVRPAREHQGRVVLGPLGSEDADADEYVVEMRRFDEHDTMAARLADGLLTEADLVAVARRVAGFHAQSPAHHREDPVGALRDRIDQDFDDLDEAHVPAGTTLLRGTARGLLRRQGELIAQRADAGLVRDGHGDLRAEHVLLSYGLPIVDRLEFDASLRHADVADDLAFLAMDLEARGARWAADRLLAAYAEAGGAGAPPPLAAGFAWHRAVVRVKVALLSGDSDAAKSLLVLAQQLGWRARGSETIVVCGPPASGKSTLAHLLGERLELPVISSDRVRKELLGIEPRSRAPAAAYEPDVTARVYAELRDRAVGTLRAGASGVILDATYRSTVARAGLSSSGVGRVGWIWCDPPAQTLVERARQREADEERESDAGPLVARRLADAFEPLDDEDSVLRLRGAHSEADALAAVATWLDRESPARHTI